MKRIKIFSLILLLTGAMTLSVQAQAPRGKRGMAQDPEARAEMMTQRMTERLKLTESQAAEVYKINLETAKEMQTMQEANRKRAQTFQQSRVDQLSDILTEEQLATYKEGQARMMERKEMMRSPEGRAEINIQRMTENLGLTEDQADQIYQIRQEQRDEIRSIMQGADDKAAAREEARAVKAEADEQIKGILNADQQKKWEEMKARTCEPGSRKGRKGKR